MEERKMEKNYARIEAVIYVELRPGDTLEDAEDRFLESLPDGIDCAGYKSDMWVPDEEQ